jgi:hypothetical protein
LGFRVQSCLEILVQSLVLLLHVLRLLVGYGLGFEVWGLGFRI